MSLVPKYTNEEKIEHLTQMDIDNTTDPSSVEVLKWIEGIEAEIDAKKLGWANDRKEGEGYLAKDIYLTVPRIKPTLRPLDRFKLLSKGLDPRILARGMLIPLQELEYWPIIPEQSITLKRRTTTDLTEKPEWEDLTRGYYPGWVESKDSDYMVITTRGRAGQTHGIAFLIYSDKEIKTGPAALKASYSYGWNLPSAILSKYCTLKVGIRVLEAAVEAGEPTRIATFTGGDFQTFVNTELTATINRWKESIAALEKKYFPREARANILWI